MKRGSLVVCAILLAHYGFAREAYADADGGTDEDAPRVEIVEPTAKSTFDAPANVHVVVEATDDIGVIESGVRNVTLRVDGGEGMVDDTAPYEFDLELGEGMYVLVATAEDNAGNSRDSIGVDIAVFPGASSESGSSAGEGSDESGGCAVSRPRPRDTWTAGLAFGIAVFAGVMLRRRRED